MAMHLYSNQFSEEHNFPNSCSPRKFLIIASTARSGSHMLGHALFATRGFGFPLEYFNPANFARWKAILGTKNVVDTLQKLFGIRTSENGVFSLKIHYPQLAVIGGFRNLLQLFPDAYYVFLKRDDLVKQAVSYALALQTGIWISGQDPIGNARPEYNFELIHKCLGKIVRENSRWIYAFQTHGISYKEIEFGQIKNDIKDAILEIADYAGVNIRPSMTESIHKTSEQGGDLNASWVRRYLEEAKKRDFNDYSGPD